jgi:hypothetical protein
MQLYVPVLALVLGFGGLSTLADNAALDGRASLADESIDARCARNSGVCLACLDNSFNDGAMNECGPITYDRLAGNVGATNLSYVIRVLDIAF